MKGWVREGRAPQDCRAHAPGQDAEGPGGQGRRHPPPALRLPVRGNEKGRAYAYEVRRGARWAWCGKSSGWSARRGSPSTRRARACGAGIPEHRAAKALASGLHAHHDPRGHLSPPYLRGGAKHSSRRSRGDPRPTKQLRRLLLRQAKQFRTGRRRGGKANGRYRHAYELPEAPRSLGRRPRPDPRRARAFGGPGAREATRYNRRPSARRACASGSSRAACCAAPPADVRCRPPPST